MNPASKRAPQRRPPVSAGSEVRQRVEALGKRLTADLETLLATLPRWGTGPQRLAETLGISTVTASRLLRGLAQADPIATLQLIPGPRPLREIVAGAGKAGAPEAKCAAATRVIDEFDDLIRGLAGDRGALKAMLSAWLPEERGDFEAQRRQAIFKAYAELEGVAADLVLEAIVLLPSATPGRLDLVSVNCLLGVDRLRPDAVVRLSTRRLGAPSPEAPAERTPLTLDGELALDGLHTARLDAFCGAPPAPLEAQVLGPIVQYSLGPTGFGPASKVDLVIAEVNRAELPNRAADAEQPPYFFTVPEIAARRVTFDVLVHDSVYGGTAPELLTYATIGAGPAVACAPERAIDLRPSTEQVQALGAGLARLRLAEFPRYVPLMEHVFSRLGLAESEFRGYRFSQVHPLVGRQFTFAFTGR